MSHRRRQPQPGRAILVERGVTYSALAEALGCSRDWAQAVLSRSAPPPARFRRELSEFLGVPENRLFDADVPASQPIVGALRAHGSNFTRLAAELGVSRTWVRRNCDGWKPPTKDFVRRASERLGLPPEALFHPGDLA